MSKVVCKELHVKGDTSRVTPPKKNEMIHKQALITSNMWSKSDIPGCDQCIDKIIIG